MLSDFLEEVLTKSCHAPDGCGMSTRPEYYSGRGATRTDLDDSKLEKVWTAIQTHRGAKAAEAFVRMIESIKVLSATNFLLALASFDAAGFKWEHEMAPTGAGVYATDPIVGLFTVLATSHRRGDESRTIKDPFLIRRGRKIKPPAGGRNIYGY